MLLTVLSFLALLGVLVILHELGHFVTAKLAGVKVLEFGFGYPPRLLGIRRGETLFSINLLPLGGFVKLLGEEDPSDPRSLAAKGVGTRFIILSAGSFMNAILPVVIFAVLFMTPQQTVVGDVRILVVEADSPAQAAGLQPGDRIISIDGRAVDNANDVAFLVQLNLGAKTPWVVERNGQPLQTSLVPRYRPPAGEGASGVRLMTQRVQVAHLVPGSLAESVGLRSGDGLLTLEGYVIRRQDQLPQLLELVRGPDELDVADLRVWREDHLVTLSVPTSSSDAERLLAGLQLSTTPTETRSTTFWKAVPKGAVHVWEILVLAKNEITSWIVGGKSPEVTGPIGIAQLTGEVARSGFLPFLEFTALLSINLAILNILPIPALDGGRLLFVAIEWVRRGKRISPQREGLVHLVGFAVLLSLIALISFRDISRIISGESLFR